MTTKEKVKEALSTSSTGKTAKEIAGECELDVRVVRSNLRMLEERGTVFFKEHATNKNRHKIKFWFAHTGKKKHEIE